MELKVLLVWVWIARQVGSVESGKPSLMKVFRASARLRLSVSKKYNSYHWAAKNIDLWGIQLLRRIQLSHLFFKMLAELVLSISTTHCSCPTEFPQGANSLVLPQDFL